MTVSKVINNTGRISEKTRQRVRSIMQEMNYVPNSTARSLVLQKTKLLHLLITDIMNPFFTTAARGAEDTARRHGYQLLFSNTDEDSDKEKETIQTMISTRVDGVLITPVGDRSREHLELLDMYNIPYVLLDREVPGVDADIVVGDNKEGARKLVDLLLSQGHRRIAFLGGSLETSTAKQRLEGYKESLALASVPYDDRLVRECGFNAHELGPFVSELFDVPERPTALFAANNLIALASVRALKKLGLGVPEHVSVVCFDDLNLEYVLDPFLTVISQPAYDFGAVGIELLMERIQGVRERRRKVVLPTQLITRSSTRDLTPGHSSGTSPGR